MRILQLKTSAARGGAETLVLLMSMELVHRGHEVLTVTGEPGWLPEQLCVSGLHALIFPMTSPIGFLRFRRLASLARGRSPEIILSHGARANLFGCALSMLTGVPLVTVEHSVDDWRDCSPCRNLVDRIIGRISRKRIAVSRAVQDMLVRKAILPADKIVTIPNGFKLRLLSNPADERRRTRQSLGLADSDVVLVTVARFVKAKGHHVLVEALQVVLARFPAVKVLLVGEGPLLPLIRQQLQVAGIAQQTLTPGALDNVPEVLASCDLFVLPSLWEGLPVALLEAMGTGLATVATAVGGIPEVVQSGKTGLLVPPGDSRQLANAICSLLQDGRQRADLAQAGQDYVNKHHRVELMTDRYIEVLQACKM